MFGQLLLDIGIQMMAGGLIVYGMGLVMDALTPACHERYMEALEDELAPEPPAIILVETVPNFPNQKTRVNFKLDEKDFDDFKKKLVESRKKRVEAHRRLDEELDAEERECKEEKHPKIKTETTEAIDLTKDEETQLIDSDD